MSEIKQLRSLMESVQINESTNSNVGIMNQDGSIDMIYVHWDGDVDGVGADVSGMSWQEASRVVKQGDASVIGDPYTDRGEDYNDVKPNHYANIADAQAQMQEYMYICVRKGSQEKWVYSDHGGEFQDLNGGDEPVQEDDDNGMIPRDEYEQAIHDLQIAQHTIAQGTEMLENALESSEVLQGDLSRWKAYGLARLKIVIGSGEYASHDESIQNLIDKLEEDLAGYPE